MNKYIFSLFISLTFASFSLKAGGGWPQPQGHGYFKLYQWWIVADQHFTSTGGVDPNLTQGIFNTTLYAEYGFTDRFTGIVNFPFFSRAYFNNEISGTTGDVITPGEAINSVGDADLGFQYGLVTGGSIAVSARLVLGLNLGKVGGGTEGNLQTGDGEFNQMLQVDAGTSFKLFNADGYANAFAGFNNRNRGFSDEFRAGIEGGLTFNQKLTTTLRVFGVKSFRNGDDLVGFSETTVFANNTEFLSISPEISYNFNQKWGASVGAGFAALGNLILADPSYSVGIFFRL